MAIANEAGVELDLEDFDRIASRTPLIADLKPGGRFVATDLYAAGGVRPGRQAPARRGLLHGDALTVTGRTLAEEAAEARETKGQEVVADRRSAQGHGWPCNPARQPGARRLRGQARRPRTRRAHGPARVFESEADAFAAVKAQSIEPGDVVVIRNEGPAAGPACARCCRSPRRWSARAWGKTVALLTDGRFSGATHG